MPVRGNSCTNLLAGAGLECFREQQVGKHNSDSQACYVELDGEAQEFELCPRATGSRGRAVGRKSLLRPEWVSI